MNWTSYLQLSVCLKLSWRNIHMPREGEDRGGRQRGEGEDRGERGKKQN